MYKKGLMLFSALLMATVIGAAVRPELRTVAAIQDATQPGASTPQTKSKMPLYFVENRGQLDAGAGYDTGYVLDSRDRRVFFTSQGVTFLLMESPPQKDITGDFALSGADPLNDARLSEQGKSKLDLLGSLRLSELQNTNTQQPEAPPPQTLNLDFVNARQLVEPAGEDSTPTVVSYMKGPSGNWKTGLRTYHTLRYSNLWPGIDLVYHATGNQLKYEFVLQPGGQPTQIQMAYRDATAVRVNAAGELEVSTPVGDLKDEKPTAYQMIRGKRVAVAVEYALSGDAHGYGFNVGEYDPTKPLVIDPAYLVYASYFGSALFERGLGIALDNHGATYITGLMQTWAPHWSDDAYVAKLNPEGTALEYVAIIGGTGQDYGFDIAVDQEGSAYITGANIGGDFPVIGGPDLSFNGYVDAFVAKLNPTGTDLVWSGYIGGTGIDFAEGIAVNDTGNVYVTGVTQFTWPASFPAVVGPDVTQNGQFDTFVAKLKADPTDPIVQNNFEYSGFIGGADNDVGIIDGSITDGHIALDASGNAYISGMTRSTEATFPDGDGFGAVPGVDQTHNGGYDAYVVKVNPAGTGLVYAGYIGGAGDDYGFGMAVDSEGNAYFTGLTNSTEATFPDGDGFGAVPGVDQTYNGGYDAYVVKVNPAGTGLVYAGYIGGAGDDQGLGLALDGSGNAYVVGRTESAEDTFPVVEGPDLTYNDARRGQTVGVGDAFVAKVDPAGTGLIYNGYIGGANSDAGFWIVVDASENATIVGDTESDGLSFPDGDGFGCAFRGLDQSSIEGDAFIAKISPVPAPPFIEDTTLVVGQDTTLTADHVGKIIIAADDVTLDCSGYAVTAPASNPGQGAGICLESWDRVTVRNCRVEGFDNGILLSGASGSTLTGNTASANSERGFALVDISGNTMTGNTASANGRFGFDLRFASNNTVADNVAINNFVQGFLILESDGNTLTGNTASWTTVGSGFVVGGNSNTVKNNTASDNESNGFSVGGFGNTVQGNTATRNGGSFSGVGFGLGGSANLFKENTAEDNKSRGFSMFGNRLFSPADNVITDNVFRGSGVGIYISDSTNNTFERNVVENNRYYGFHLTSFGYGNELAGNTFTANNVQENGAQGFRLESYFYGNVAGNTFTANNVQRNGAEGFRLAGSFYGNVAGNTFTANHSQENGGNGFGLEGEYGGFAKSNTFTGNYSQRNGGDGFNICRGCGNNILEVNTAEGNGRWGYFDASTDNTYSENTCVGDTWGGSSPAGLCVGQISDTTPPSITPNVNCDTPGNALWCKGTITVSWAVADPESPVISTSGCDTTTIGSDTPSTGTTLTCSATSPGGTASQSVTVFRDGTAPTVSCNVIPNLLWPPNHKLVSVTASVTVVDSLSGPAGFTLIAVTSNEPDSGLGDEDKPNDIQGFAMNSPDTSGQLRAERSDAGSGRIYTLTYQGMDMAGNASTCATASTVPHNN